MKDLFLAELDRQADATRRTLERVPEQQEDWKPHPKSMPLGYLAILSATVLSWISLIVDQDEFDVNPEGKPRESKPFGTRENLQAMLDDSVAKARKSLEATTDEHLMTKWRFLSHGHEVSNLPRHEMIRDAVFSHLAHHRGQLGVYLRLNDKPVPAIYGPSADEPG